MTSETRAGYDLSAQRETAATQPSPRGARPPRWVAPAALPRRRRTGWGWGVDRGFGESTPLGRWCGGGVVRIKGARKLSPEKLAATQNLGSACSRMHTGLPVLGTLTEPSRHHEFLGHDSFGNRCDQWFHGNTDTQPSMAGPCPPRETACLRTSEVLAQNTVSDGPAQVLSGGNGHWPICQLKISLGGG